MDKFYKERFLRSIGIFSEDQLYKIKSKKIAIAGLGLGGSVFLNLVRLGFENFHIADPDTFERTNINRQRLAKESTIGLRKDECSLSEAKAINPNVNIRLFSEGVKSSNLDEFLNGVDWVVDVVDVFAMSDKLALNVEARKRSIPVSSCATLGFSGSVIVFKKETPSFAELTGISESNSYEENLSRFLRFMAPEIPEYMAAQLAKAMDKSSYVPFIPCGGELAAAMTAAEIAKNFVGLGKRVLAPKGIFIDSAQVKTEIFEANYKVRPLSIQTANKSKAA
ncbi:MAG: ThiF family adenylyltransferase [Pseudobdellovibrionaceae bacterium]